MEVLEVRQPRLGGILYQCELLNKLNLNQLTLSFKQSSTIPSIEVMNNLMDFLDQAIEDSSLDTNDKRLVLELQIILVSSIVGGFFPEQLIKLDIASLKNHKLLKDFKYLNHLICEIQSETNNKGMIFSAINKELVFVNLNFLLTLNGIESTLSEGKLKILHGRYHYLSRGNLRSVRDMLCKKLKATDHIDLLVKLRLIDSYHIS